MDSDEEVEYEPERFQIRNFVFDITTVSFMPIHKLMDLNARKSEISGQKIWCGSVSLMEYLLDHPSLIENCNVIELGAGTGLAGMLSCKLDARKVWLTDNDETSLRHMASDCSINGVEAVVTKLDWFDFNISSSEFANLQPPLRIIAGDVLYKHLLLQPFFSTASSLLESCPGSTMILSHVARAGVQHEEVQATARSVGLEVEEIERATWSEHECLKQFPPEDIAITRIYVMKKA